MREGRHASPRLLVLITREEDHRRLRDLLEDLQIPILFQCRGKGTAPSEMLDIFGLSGTTRQVTAGLLPREAVAGAFTAFRQHLSVHQRGRGIAITLPVTGLQAPVLELLEQRQAPEENTTEGATVSMQEKSGYVVIWTSVDSGFSDDVVDAARAAGAKGGTVLKGLRRTSERSGQQLGLPLQEGQEFVMIVAPREKKGDILSAISAACGLRSEAHGLVLSLPVEDAVGLED